MTLSPASAAKLLADSELVLAQEFLYTPFDWRIGVLAGEPLYACKYFMARKHWQIYDHSGNKTREGDVGDRADRDGAERGGARRRGGRRA